MARMLATLLLTFPLLLLGCEDAAMNDTPPPTLAEPYVAEPIAPITYGDAVYHVEVYPVKDLVDAYVIVNRYHWTPEEVVDELIEAIQDAVDPESWGAAATVRCLGNEFIITQTAANHRGIAALLAELRRVQGPSAASSPYQDAPLPEWATVRVTP
jgi:hypothetical protein